jgi:uncharacterized membrane-anchored protein
MLGASAIFLFCGVFMLGIVYVWTTRRQMFRDGENRHSRESGNLDERLVSLGPRFRGDDEPDFVPPPWLATICDKMTLLWQSERNILTAVVVVALLQFTVLGAMIANEMRPHISGMTIRVATVPVDPRDLFRGDYVTLRYEFSGADRIPGSHIVYNSINGYGTMSETVYVTMEQDGELWKAVGLSHTKPKDGVFLRGTRKPYSNGIEYGIESYYVQEGTGKPIENAMRRDGKGVIVELVVAPDGKASIKTVHAPE